MRHKLVHYFLLSTSYTVQYHFHHIQGKYEDSTSQRKNQMLHQFQSNPTFFISCMGELVYLYSFLFPFNTSSLAPDMRPCQFAFEICTRVIDHRTRRAATSTSTTLLRRVTAVIARGSAICRCTIANRRGNYIVTRRYRQPTRG